MTQTEPLLTSTEAGRILGKSGRTVQRLVAQGRLTPAQTLSIGNGAHLFREADIRAYAAAADDAA